LNRGGDGGLGEGAGGGDGSDGTHCGRWCGAAAWTNLAKGPSRCV
jgi:hypothetical protein